MEKIKKARWLIFLRIWSSKSKFFAWLVKKTNTKIYEEVVELLNSTENINWIEENKIISLFVKKESYFENELKDFLYKKTLRDLSILDEKNPGNKIINETWKLKSSNANEFGYCAWICYIHPNQRDSFCEKVIKCYKELSFGEQMTFLERWRSSIGGVDFWLSNKNLFDKLLEISKPKTLEEWKKWVERASFDTNDTKKCDEAIISLIKANPDNLKNIIGVASSSFLEKNFQFVDNIIIGMIRTNPGDFVELITKIGPEGFLKRNLKFIDEENLLEYIKNSIKDLEMFIDLMISSKLTEEEIFTQSIYYFRHLLRFVIINRKKRKEYFYKYKGIHEIISVVYDRDS